MIARTEPSVTVMGQGLPSFARSRAPDAALTVKLMPETVSGVTHQRPRSAPLSGVGARGIQVACLG
jgi:hypothetical protein